MGSCCLLLFCSKSCHKQDVESCRKAMACIVPFELLSLNWHCPFIHETISASDMIISQSGDDSYNTLKENITINKKHFLISTRNKMLEISWQRNKEALNEPGSASKTV